jgi:hypothetical protein
MLSVCKIKKKTVRVPLQIGLVTEEYIFRSLPFSFIHPYTIVNEVLFGVNV